MVVPVRHLDDQPPVGATEPQPHGGHPVLKGIGDEFAHRQHAEVMQFDREPPARQHAGGERTRAWSRLDAAQQFQRGVAEEVAVGAGVGRVLEDHDGHVVVVFRGDAGRADQTVADHLGSAGGAGQGAFEGGDALVQVLVAALDQAVGVEDGRGTGAERDGTRGVHPAAGAQGRAGGFVGAQDDAALVADQDGQVAGRCVDQLALVRVVDGVHAGGDLVGVDLHGEAVEELEDLVRREVQAGVRPDRCAELAHDRRRADPAAHDVADDQGRAAAAERDDVVPVAADRGLRAARVVGGGDAQVVGFFELLGEQAALEGDGGLALAALAGSEALGGLGVVGDVGREDENAPAAPVSLGHRGAGEGVGTAVGGLAGLDRAGLAAAQDLVEEREQADLLQLREGLAGRFARGTQAEGDHIGVVDVGEAVVGAVDEGDEGGDTVEDFADGKFVDGGGRHGQLFGAGRGDGSLAQAVLGDQVVGLRRRAALRSGEAGAPAREVHESLPRVVVFGVFGPAPGPAGGWGRQPGGAARWENLLVRGAGGCPSEVGHQSGRVTDRVDIRQTPGRSVEFLGPVRTTPSGRSSGREDAFHRPRVRTPLGDVRVSRGRRSPS